MIGDILFQSNNKYDIPLLDITRQPTGLLQPVGVWGAQRRTKSSIGTWLFYVDDYRFNALIKNPDRLILTGAKYAAELNISLFDTTPIAEGLQKIYIKRWISRYLQEKGICIYADLNVSKKFYEYNQLGIPDGYNAFITRGYCERFDDLKEEWQIARKISQRDMPNFIVYGGGNIIKEWCINKGI